MIEFRNLTKRFGTKTAVEPLDLVLNSGEVFGFLGPNGAGKTTTIRMMVGLLKPTSGTVVYHDGERRWDIQRDNLAARSRIGYIPDAPFLYEKLTGREHMRFIGEIYGVDSPRLEVEIARFLALFSLEEVADQPIEGYSHGMRQKVVMSCALLHQPKVLVVDEPMVGLDPRSARLVKDLFKSLAREKGVTLFLSTHSLDVAEEVCDRIGIISRGRIVTLGTTEELMRKEEGGTTRLEEVFLRVTAEEGLPADPAVERSAP
jgi:ABC-2 type transport system ATP-binding protein